MSKKTKMVQCYKCLGNKRFDSFSHVAGGKCFACGGTGKVSVDSWNSRSNRDVSIEELQSVVIDFGRQVASHNEGNNVLQAARDGWAENKGDRQYLEHTIEMLRFEIMGYEQQAKVAAFV